MDRGIRRLIALAALLAAAASGGARHPPGVLRRRGNATRGGVIDVTDFGAVCDGKTDSTAAIQAALNAGVGKVVHFPHCGVSSAQRTHFHPRRGHLPILPS